MMMAVVMIVVVIMIVMSILLTWGKSSMHRVAKLLDSFLEGVL